MPDPDTIDNLSRRSFLRAGGAAAVASVVGNAALAETEQAAADKAAAAGAREGITSYAASGAKVTLKVNGQDRELSVTPATTLLAALREQLDLTGCKEVCDRGACGACTVLVNGRSVNSCLMLAIDAAGSEVTTVEGLADNGTLHPVQQAFAECDACQCGYCIPGFVVRSRALLAEMPGANREQIKEGLSGNICRCAAYARIFQAVEAAAAKGGGQ